VIRKNLDIAKGELFGREAIEGAVEMVAFARVLELHDDMLCRARLAIFCWSVVDRRLGVARDVRVMIAKMAWEDAWRWGGRGDGEGAEGE
jgi:hypothetical protein